MLPIWFDTSNDTEHDPAHDTGHRTSGTARAVNAVRMRALSTKPSKLDQTGSS